jgi:hypothetical protein
MLDRRGATRFQPDNPGAIHARFERIKKRALERADSPVTPAAPPPARSWRAVAAAKRARIAST